MNLTEKSGRHFILGSTLVHMEHIKTSRNLRCTDFNPFLHKEINNSVKIQVLQPYLVQLVFEFGAQAIFSHRGFIFNHLKQQETTDAPRANKMLHSLNRCVGWGVLHPNFMTVKVESGGLRQVTLSTSEFAYLVIREYKLI